MKKQGIFPLITLIAWLVPLQLVAYKSDKIKPANTSSHANNKGANCAPATAKIIMNFNDVKCTIEQGGGMWQNRATSTAAYEVPAGSGLKVIYAGSLWMGGVSSSGNLKLAGLTFRNANDFWPGPLTASINGNYNPGDIIDANTTYDYGEATIDPDQCLAYDRFYTIRKAEVVQYSVWWESCSGPNANSTECDKVTKPSNDVLNRIYAWPAHGDVSRGQDYYLAPFYDNPNGTFGANGEYDPADGDTPWYDDILNRDDIECGVDRRVSLYGDETHWWVFNDSGNNHGESGGIPIGMEIRAQAFSFATNDEINRMTFYNYELINRASETLKKTYFAQYIDADVGNGTDDYTGCDVSRGLGYMYNGDNLDQSEGGAIGYGENPPAVGCDFFEGPYMDPDGRDNVGPTRDPLTGQWSSPTVADAIQDNGIVYRGIGVGYSDGILDNERFGMRLFTYYTNGAPPAVSDPDEAQEFYSYMTGAWANGDSMVFGGTGFPGSAGSTNIISTYMFPGDSDPLNWGTKGNPVTWNWTEANVNGSGASSDFGDRRFVQSAGPFTLRPGAVNNITVGIVYGRGADGNALSSVEAMKRADTKAQALFDACFRILDPPNAPRLAIQELENQLVLTLENPLGSNNHNETYSRVDDINIPDNIIDREYVFEGYQIYQLIDDAASIADIDNSEKARIVAQCDIKNDVANLINWEFDEALGFSIPTLKVDANNQGIQHSFLMTEDAFAQGDKKLVNHKTYYYVAIAYAFNEFKKYDVDPLYLDGQKTPYISSRIAYDGGSIRSVVGIPHNPAPEADGTIQNIAYGSGPLIRRLDGFGNGHRALELTKNSLDYIVENGFMENPIYDHGKGPINVKVVDPLNVADGYYECLFRDYTASNSNAADTASWIINRYDKEGGTLLESIESDRTIGIKVTGDDLVGTNNEQLIPQWGISVQINQSAYYYPDGAPSGQQWKTSDLLSASLTYADSSKRWLSGVTDQDNYTPTNWIRSGDYDPTKGTVDESDDDCTDANSGGYIDYYDPCNYPDELNVDADRKWSNILGGTVAPHRLTGYQSSYMPMAYLDYAPNAARWGAAIPFLPSVDIVMTSDTNLWTRCPVIELGRNPALTIGGAKSGEMRNSKSVHRNGRQDNSSIGMGWFPGYAIDIESGARLYMAFGENSYLISDHGGDMLWNPSARTTDDFGGPVLGGMHPIYIFSYGHKSKNNYEHAYDYPAYIPAQAQSLNGHVLYNHMLQIEANAPGVKKNIYSCISWIAYPLLAPNSQLLATDAKLSLRVGKEYKDFSNISAPKGGPNGGKPMYSWSMDDIRTETGSADQLSSVLDYINVVPNPYYAYSEYEDNRLDTRVKITNLPERCTVKIYTVNGKLVRDFEKDSPITSLDWDLNNHRGIPVASGIYLIHVEVPDIGEVVLKFFGGIRQIDLQGI